MTVQGGILAPEDIGPKLLGQGVVIGEAVEKGLGGSHGGGLGGIKMRKEVILYEREGKREGEEKKSLKRGGDVMSFGVNQFGGVGGAAG